MRQWIAISLMAMLVNLAWVDRVCAESDVDELRALIEQIAKGKDTGGEAAEDLIDLVVGPLAEAVGKTSDRPIEEQARIAEAMSRLTANLRIQLHRVELGNEDRVAFDHTHVQKPELVESLFSDREDTRLKAIDQIPLKKNSVAGVLLALCAKDESMAVSDKAFKKAAELGDPIVVRNLAQQMKNVTTVVEKGFKDRRYFVFDVIHGEFLNKVVRIVGEKGSAEQLPIILDAFEQVTDSSRSIDVDYIAYYKAMGNLGDEAVAPVLLKGLRNRKGMRVVQCGNKEADSKRQKTIHQDAGDVALLALLKIYKLKPEPLGFVMASERWDDGGLRRTELREQAVKQFEKWYDDNKDKPVAQRAPLEMSE